MLPECLFPRQSCLFAVYSNMRELYTGPHLYTNPSHRYGKLQADSGTYQSLTPKEHHSAHPDEQIANWLYYSTTLFGTTRRIVICLQIQMLQTPDSVVDVDQHSICLCIVSHGLAIAWKVCLATLAVSAHVCCIRLAGLLTGQQQRCGSADSSAEHL